MGRHGQRRPLMIELLSKQMKRYILENQYLFNNSGLTVYEYLDRKSIEQRKKQTLTLIKVRKEGHHAVIRDNILIINGRKYQEPFEQLDIIPNKSSNEEQEKYIRSQESFEASNDENVRDESKDEKSKPVTAKTPRQVRTTSHTFRKRL